MTLFLSRTTLNGEEAWFIHVHNLIKSFYFLTKFHENRKFQLTSHRPAHFFSSRCPGITFEHIIPVFFESCVKETWSLLNSQQKGFRFHVWNPWPGCLGRSLPRSRTTGIACTTITCLHINSLTLIFFQNLLDADWVLSPAETFAVLMPQDH